MLYEVITIGELDNTLIIVTADNGASGEGGLAGTFNETYVLNGLQTPFKVNLRYYDRWGDETTYPHYHAGWAMAGRITSYNVCYTKLLRFCICRFVGNVDG